MKLIWHGHSCFTLECNDGIIVFDPFENDSVPGLQNLSLQAHQVLCSHEHSDHNARDKVVLLQEKKFNISQIDTYHDHHKGSLRGNNRIYIVESENMKVVHLGDIGCLLDDYRQIENCDVLMIPIGGYYTINYQEALTIIKCVQPRIVVPMHYRSENFGYDVLDTALPFIQSCQNVMTYNTNMIDITKETKQQVALLKYT